MMRIWDRVEQALVGVLGLAALGFALWQIVSRYFLPQDSISYAEEVIVYLMMWAILIVSSQLVRTDSHIRPDLELNVAPPKVMRWLEVFNGGFEPIDHARRLVGPGRREVRGCDGAD